MLHSPSKCLSGPQISYCFEELPVQRIQLPLPISPISKPKLSIRYYAIFLPFMTFIKHGFQSEILRTVDSKSSFCFVHLAKKYGTLSFKDSIQGQYEFMLTLFFSWGSRSQYRLRLRPIPKILHYTRLAIFGLYSLQ